jgi:hypothetical protein
MQFIVAPYNNLKHGQWAIKNSSKGFMFYIQVTETTWSSVQIHHTGLVFINQAKEAGKNSYTQLNVELMLSKDGLHETKQSIEEVASVIQDIEMREKVIADFKAKAKKHLNMTIDTL